MNVLLFIALNVVKNLKPEINIVLSVVLNAYNYKTNNSGQFIEFEILGNLIQFRVLPFNLRGADILIFLKNKHGEDFCRSYVKGLRFFKVENIPDGIYFLQIYIYVPQNKQYWSFLNERSIAFLLKSNRLIIIKHPYLYSNIDGIEKFIKRNCNNHGLLRPTNQIQSNDSNIIKLSKEITEGKITHYSKVLAVHDWVADNIYYDIDAYKSGRYITNDNSALATLNNRCAVCQGYSNLTIALLRSLGYFAAEIQCNSSIDVITKEWRPKDSIVSNHVITTVFVNNKWIIMDVTWDSDKIVISTERTNRTGIGKSHLYFDPTWEFISATHQLIF